MIRFLQLSIFVFAMGVVGLPAAAEMKSTDGKHCQKLMAMFDRLVPEFDRLVPERDRAAPATRRNRQLGEAECQKGNYAGGEKLLEMALMSVGYKPPQS